MTDPRMHRRSSLAFPAGPRMLRFGARAIPLAGAQGTLRAPRQLKSDKPVAGVSLGSRHYQGHFVPRGDFSTVRGRAPSLLATNLGET